MLQLNSAMSGETKTRMTSPLFQLEIMNSGFYNPNVETKVQLLNLDFIFSPSRFHNSTIYTQLLLDYDTNV